MNIFTVLSQGNARLHETSMSAMIAYLLSPYQTHGIGDTFLRRFLKTIANECKDPSRFDEVLQDKRPIDAEVLLEEPYLIENTKRVIDIEVRIYKHSTRKTDNPQETHRVAIENKIKYQAADPQQFQEEYLGISTDSFTPVTMVFLTPSGIHPKLLQEYDALELLNPGHHSKVWISWDEDGSRSHLTGILRDILEAEARGEIHPISEYVRHTLKAFLYHIEEYIKPSIVRLPIEAGELVDFVEVGISSGDYRIERYESQTIRVFNLETEAYEAALPSLIRINNEKDLRIDTEGMNTRSLGRKVIEKLKSNSQLTITT